MEETKVIHTLSDAVDAYRKQMEEQAKRSAELDEEARQETLNVLNSLGLIPLRIEERNLAIFEYEGQEIKLRIFRDNYWQVLRQDVCKYCGKEIRSFNRALVVEDVGELVVNPSWEYHTCIDETTPEGNLISALRNALGAGYE